MTTKLDQSAEPTDEVSADWTPPRGMPRDSAPADPAGGAPEGRPRGSGWMVVTALGVVAVVSVGAATTARVGAIALAVLVVGCAVVRAAAEPGPAALSVRSRRVDLLVLVMLAVALGAVATQLPAS